ncbi:MAG: hypothetical protein ABJ308_13485 [Halieaceae bacterium]
MAWLIYTGATLLGLLVLYYWVGDRLGASTRLVLALLLGLVALTPAHPTPDGTTWAPALFVMGFDFLTYGIEALGRAARPILVAEALAVVLLLLVYLGRRLFNKG